jgi:hypothetical protein
MKMRNGNESLERRKNSSGRRGCEEFERTPKN